MQKKSNCTFVSPANETTTKQDIEQSDCGLLADKTKAMIH
jgi:hypothetical protein